MYQILSATGLLDNLDGRYQTVEVGTMRMVDIYAKYQRVYLTLTHTVVGGKYTLNMDKLPPLIKIQSYTLNEFLFSNGSASLPVEDKLITLDYATVRFYNLWNAGFIMKPVNRAFHPDMVIPWEEQTDLLCTKPGANAINMTKYGLFTVNGFMHIGDTLEESNIIYNGCETGRLGQDTHVGFLDFQRVGELKCYPITKDMVYKRHPDSVFKESVYIKVPVSMAGKTPLLSIGGYLHALDGMYTAVSDRILKFNFNKYNWLKRYLVAKGNINCESLEVGRLSNGAIDYQSLFSDDVIERWFTLPQSFIVLVDVPELNVSTMEVEYSGLPGVYYSYQKPKYPLILGEGMVAEYSQSQQRQTTVLRTAKYLQNNLSMDLTTTVGWKAAATHNVTTEPLLPAIARFLIISKTVEVKE